jgi:hypothetical protein
MTAPYRRLAVPKTPISPTGFCAEARIAGFEGLAAKLTDGANFYFESAPHLPKFVRG